MKKIITGSLALLLFMGAAQAQTKDSTRQHHGAQHHMMAQDLNLTEAQKTKLKAIREEQHKEMESLKTSSLSKEASVEKRKEIQQKYRNEFNSVLTADQKAQLEKQKTERKAKGKEAKKDFKGKGKGHKGGFDKGGKMAQELNLTADQKAKMEGLHKSSRSQFESIRNDKSLTDAQKKEKMQSLRKQQHEAMKSILTPEQLKKMESFKKDRKPATTK